MYDDAQVIMPHRRHKVYRRAALLTLLAYAKAHHHSRFWIGPLTRLLAREEEARG